jgi:hypothetical protein
MQLREASGSNTGAPGPHKFARNRKSVRKIQRALDYIGKNARLSNNSRAFLVLRLSEKNGATSNLRRFFCGLFFRLVDHKTEASG